MIGLMAMMLAATQPATPLLPSGKWLVDYNADMCLVSRPFGAAEAPATFAIKPAIVFGSGRASLYILRPNEKGDGVRRGTAKITVQPSGETFSALYVSSVPKNGKLRGYEFAANSDLMSALGDSTGLALDAGSDRIAFQTGKMRALYDALDACNANLLKSWGVDPAARAELPRNVSPESWFPPNSYPSEARRRGATGRVTVIVTVGEDGGVTACRVAVSARDPDLDKATCDLARAHGRYAPAPGKADRYSALALSWMIDG